MSTVRAGHIKLRRAYDPAEPADGPRILVDRLWPRGLSRDDAGIDRWLKDLAPSSELRKWFGHDPGRWDEFRDRYATELSRHSDQVKELRELARKGPITLVYSAHDEVHNNAVVLRDFVLGRINLAE
ncbi:MAG TPA: DUF488 domain-containing protein [Candidatus Acidoferrum sp.]|nr:DUF488 domain-containing protein [Candidatus Acidoferrum sp.]